MRIPSVDVDMPEGYETEDGKPVFVKVPRSIRSGTITAITELNRSVTAKQSAGEDADDTVLHDMSEIALDLVTEWNMDDRQGKPLPLLRQVVTKVNAVSVPGKTNARDPERERVIAEVPIEIIMKIVETVSNTDRDKRPA